jgi:hypothetical protein
MPKKMASTKRCIRCMRLKLRAKFYKHPQMGDGFLNVCKECVKARVKAHAKANPEKIRKITREKRRRPKYREKYKKWLEVSPQERQATRDKWDAANRQKRKAEWTVSNAIRDGKLIKPNNCQRCGKKGNCLP